MSSWISCITVELHSSCVPSKCFVDDESGSEFSRVPRSQGRRTGTNILCQKKFLFFLDNAKKEGHINQEAFTIVYTYQQVLLVLLCFVYFFLFRTEHLTLKDLKAK